MKTDRKAIADLAGALLADVAGAQPLVQSITNYVSMDLAANALLAIGASPVMVRAPEESAELAPALGALVINIGTLTKSSADQMEAAATAARMHARPWLLDPVGAGALSMRDATVMRLLRHRPAIIRGNASEIIAVARILGLTVDTAAPRGVDSTSTSGDAESSAIKLAHHCQCAVVATGAADVVTDGQTTIRINNGSTMMTRVTALGCSLSSVMGAFLAVARTPFEAAIAATIVYAIAGEIAAEKSEGPASFRTAFLDMLHGLRASDIQTRLRLV